MSKETIAERLAEFNQRVASSAHQLFPDMIQPPTVECHALFGSVINYGIRLNFPEGYLEDKKEDPASDSNTQVPD